MNTLTSAVARRRPTKAASVASGVSDMASVGGRLAGSSLVSPATAASFADASSMGASRKSGVIGEAYTPDNDGAMYDSFGPEAVGGAASYGGGGWPPSYGSGYESIGGDLPFAGSLGRFNMPVPPPAGAELTPEQAITLYGASLDVTRTQIRPVNRFDPNVINERILP